ncbi:MAG: TetR/AcrR family transcriptional regulator [Bacteroidales bacterium]|nr:TetR/AcrR family transcriptional regulator [Bacteroidales bacterium]
MISDRQQQIIEEAIKLIDEKGIQGLTIKNLSKEIGISEPGIYRHFESKFAILHMILDSFRAMIQMNHSMFMSATDEGIEKLHQLIQKVLSIFIQEPALVSVIFSEEIFHNEKQLTEMVVNIQELNEDLVRKVYLQLQAENKVSQSISPEMFSLLYFGSIRLLVKKWKQQQYSFNLLDKGEELFQTLLIAIKK